ncbi:hypothetical protein GCM10010191_58780 [Actinomadura vinacea]|uniref:Uncharacterized protein n=1 Tax=Actinomadura vinacea TaxID=115336 RepID=A0ABN3JP53_9ACTN
MADDHDRPSKQGPGEAPDSSPARDTAPAGTATAPGGPARPGGTGKAPHRAVSRMPRPPAGTLKASRKRVAGALATIVSVITTVVVVVLAVHIMFVLLEANGSNELVRTIGDRAWDLAWQFKDVFQPADRKVGVAVNYGLAALVYLLAGRLIISMIRRLG